MNKIDIYKDLKAALTVLPLDSPGREQLTLLLEKIKKDVASQLPKSENEELTKLLSKIIEREEKERSDRFGAFLLPEGAKVICGTKTFVLCLKDDNLDLTDFKERVPEETHLHSLRLIEGFMNALNGDVYETDGPDRIRGELKRRGNGTVLRKFDHDTAISCSLYLEAELLTGAKEVRLLRNKPNGPGLFCFYGEAFNVIVAPCWNNGFEKMENGFFGSEELNAKLIEERTIHTD